MLNVSKQTMLHAMGIVSALSDLKKEGITESPASLIYTALGCDMAAYKSAMQLCLLHDWVFEVTKDLIMVTDAGEIKAAEIELEMAKAKKAMEAAKNKVPN